MPLPGERIVPAPIPLRRRCWPTQYVRPRPKSRPPLAVRQNEVILPLPDSLMEAVCQDLKLITHGIETQDGLAGRIST
jgi:hypothetical protein